ncbi:MAG: hypothetical protein HQM16_04450 [Deltaproteobacteria bacterium]|nr:hypothetical protein [Deltaproteobacteria bacterium]
MKTLIATIIMMALAVPHAFATAQYPDKIVYNGKKYALYTNPMESYFNQHPSKRPKGGVDSTALWRGYVATFEIRDQTLLLKDIEIEVLTKTKEHNNEYQWKSVINKIVHKGQTLPIEWFTGTLVLPSGQLDGV